MGRLQGREEDFSLRDLDRQAIRTLGKYLRPYKGRLLLAALAMLAVTATSLGMPYLSKVAIDRYIAQGDMRGLALISLLYLGLNGIYWLGAYWQGYLSGWVGQHVVYAMRRDLFQHVLRQSKRFHEGEPVGQIVSRLTHDVNTLSEAVSGGILNLVNDLLTLTGIVVVMLMLHVRLTLVTMTAVPVVLLSMGYLGKKMRLAYRQVQQEFAAVNAGVEQSVSGMRVVQSLSKESFTVEQFESLSLRNVKANLRVSLLFAAVFPTMTITNMLGTALVLGYGGTLVAHNIITLGVLLAFLRYVDRFFGPLRELSLVYNTFQAAAASLDRIADYMNRRPEVTESAHPERPPKGFEGEVAFEGVTFGYGEGAVLHDLNVHLRAGKTVALVGPTGAGKSTFAGLLARLYDVQEGKITLDGVDLRRISFPNLRQTVMMVPQDVFLFSQSIRENIRYGRPQATDTEVEQAAKQAQAHAFIEKLPEGYDSPVGEGGALLSGGQKQLIAFARALLTSPKILILDEATANIDAYTEALIQQAMDEIRRNRTTLIIAHRFSTLRKADQIIVLEDGRIVGQGLHEDLVEHNPTYQRLYRR
ncbi:MAG: ABC transporter ATP-binding protein [Candidatus Latescibacteria bacterium]|nr:ABC transporter ATP-binding protein [Candidatus Latescibacterota bacterium]